MSILKALRERTEPLTVAELSKLLLVTQATIQKWARLKQIPCIRIGDTIRFDSTMLADWIEVQARPSAVSLRPSAAEDPAESQMKWEDVAELAGKEFRSPVTKQQTKSE